MKSNTSNKERIFVCNCGREINVIGYEREGERQGYAKALEQALVKHFQLSTISWVDWMKKELRKNA